MSDVLEDVMIPTTYSVKSFKKETHDTFTLELKSSDKKKPLLFQPGQFNMLYVFGVGEIPISISGDTRQEKTLIHTIRSVGNVSNLLSKIELKGMVGIRGPFGSSWPIYKAHEKDVIIIAGGIGLAPLRPVLYHIARYRKKYKRVILLYGARSPEDILYEKELKYWKSECDIDVHLTVDQATSAWRGNVDVVPSLIPRIEFDPKNTLAMICGPEIMMHFSIRILRQRDLNIKNIFISMERNMKCAVGFCGHCQYGPHFICKDGPVFCYEKVQNIFRVAEI